MYLAGFGVDDRRQICEALRTLGFGHVISASTGTDGNARLEATAVPFLVDDGLTSLRCHLARANQHWRSLDGSEVLVVVAGADAYVSPRWYPSKAEHHRVVPTWNYELAHLRGTVTIHDDPAWKRRLVADLTDHHEGRVVDGELARPWSVEDAPGDFIDRQLAAIVGVEIALTDIELKRKLSQNRPDADREGAADGLRRVAMATGASDPERLAALMLDATSKPADPPP